MPITGAEVWRDNIIFGVPASGAKKPEKINIRSWALYLENLALLAFTSSLVYSTRAALFANLVPGANVPALVIGDMTTGNDGLYAKVGATGTGSWSQITDFVPGAQFVDAIDIGTGTGTAYQATTNIGISATSHQLISVGLLATNSGTPVTIRFNGAGTSYTIKSVTNSNPLVGSLPLRLVGIISGTNFVLLSDLASAAVQAAAAASAAAAAADAAAAAISAAAASSASGLLDSADLAGLLANTTYKYTAGAGFVQVFTANKLRTRKEGFSYEVAASGASDHDLTTAGGVKIYVLTPDLAAYNIVGDGVTAETTKVQSAMTRFPTTNINVPRGKSVLTTLTQTQLDVNFFQGAGEIVGPSNVRLRPFSPRSLTNTIGTTVGGRTIVFNPESVTFTGTRNDSGVILGGRGIAGSYPITVGASAELYGVLAGGNHEINQLAGLISGGAHHKVIQNSAAVGSHGAVVGGSFNEVYGDYSGVAFGSQNKAYSSYNWVLGGVRCIIGDITNSVKCNYSVIASGLDNAITDGHYNAIVYGRDCLVSEYYAQAMGRGASAYMWGARAFQSSPFDDPITVKNDSSRMDFELGRATSGATSGTLSSLYLNNTSKLPTLPPGYMFSGRAIINCWRTDVVEHAAYVLEFAVKNVAGVTVALGSVVRTTYSPGGTYLVDAVGSSSGDIFQIRVRSVTNAVARWNCSVTGKLLKSA